jgi:hypothetical protein
MRFLPGRTPPPPFLQPHTAPWTFTTMYSRERGMHWAADYAERTAWGFSWNAELCFGIFVNMKAYNLAFKQSAAVCPCLHVHCATFFEAASISESSFWILTLTLPSSIYYTSPPSLSTRNLPPPYLMFFIEFFRAVVTIYPPAGKLEPAPGGRGAVAGELHVLYFHNFFHNAW